MGSPRGVPVPCTASRPRASGCRRAAARAAWMSACWEGPCGAVSADDLPSWLMQEPCAPHTLGLLRAAEQAALDAASGCAHCKQAADAVGRSADRTWMWPSAPPPLVGLLHSQNRKALPSAVAVCAGLKGLAAAHWGERLPQGVAVASSQPNLGSARQLSSRDLLRAAASMCSATCSSVPGAGRSWWWSALPAWHSRPLPGLQQPGRPGQRRRPGAGRPGCWSRRYRLTRRGPAHTRLKPPQLCLIMLPGSWQHWAQAAGSHAQGPAAQGSWLVRWRWQLMVPGPVGPSLHHPTGPHLQAKGVADAADEEGRRVARAAGGGCRRQAQLRQHLHKFVRPHGPHVHPRALRRQGCVGRQALLRMQPGEPVHAV